jgi:pre-mRNA cleavage complex 2 protein Pcf11
MPQQQMYAPPSSELEILKNDISHLISHDKHISSLNPNDIGLKARLQALQDLRNILDMRSFNAIELQAIRTQVQQLSSAGSGPPPPSMPQPQPHWAQGGSISHTFQNPQPSYSTPIPQPNVPSAAPPVLNPAALSGLQALLANVPKPSTPQLRAALPEMRGASHSQLDAIHHHTAAAPAASGANDLLSSLAKAGLIKPTINLAKPINTPAPALTQDQTAMLLKSLQGVLPPQGQNVPPVQGSSQGAAARVYVPISGASLKVFRPELIASLYDARPNQCSTCGRRFKTTDAGREEKSRHLDWHFRTNQRMADPNMNRGHHRNWYVDELEWVHHKEFDPSTAATGAGEAGAPTKAKKEAVEQFVRAPPGMTKNTCNICFEEMKSSYSEEQQDWIFTDATLNNGKIVHAQCHAEMIKSLPAPSGGGALSSVFSGTMANTRERSSTPDSTLGKRKAEGAMVGNGARVKMSQ